MGVVVRGLVLGGRVGIGLQFFEGKERAGHGAVEAGVLWRKGKRPMPAAHGILPGAFDQPGETERRRRPAERVCAAGPGSGSIGGIAVQELDQRVEGAEFVEDDIGKAVVALEVEANSCGVVWMQDVGDGAASAGERDASPGVLHEDRDGPGGRVLHGCRSFFRWGSFVVSSLCV